MDDELAFIRAIQANPSDLTAKLAYADWLEERDHHEKAEWLRLKTNLPLSNFQSPERHRLYDLQCNLLSKVWIEMIEDGGSPPTWEYVTTVGLAHLESGLKVYAGLNDHHADIHYTYTARLFVKDKSIQDVADNMGRQSKVLSTSLGRMSDWVADTQAILDKWLFTSEFRQCFNALDGPRMALATSKGRQSHSLQIISLIRDVITPVVGWNYQVTTVGYYAIDWNEILLEGKDRVLYLGFQFDD